MVCSRKWFLMVVILLFCWVGSGTAAEEAQSPPPSPASIQGTPSIQVSDPTYSFGEVQEGAEVLHTFTVKNTGKGDLQIDQVKPV